MRILRKVSEVRGWRKAESGVVGLVATMGALHEGHRSLVRAAKRECDVVTATVFVNPTQFGPTEDLDRYPRTWEADLQALRSEGVDAVFAPTADEMYREKDPEHRFRIVPDRQFSALPEAAMRPGHFSGVATVCAKLFNVIDPDRAYFGQKDALQCVALRKLVSDFNFDLDVVVCPTARDADGLALSSRNAYLTAAERRAAPVVFAGLLAAKNAWLDASSSSSSSSSEPIIPASVLLDAATAVYRAEPLVSAVEYLSLADYDTMSPLDAIPSASSPLSHRTTREQHRHDNTQPDLPLAILSVALKIGNVRLIDNLPLSGASSSLL